jgi:hypothetical protein
MLVILTCSPKLICFFPFLIHADGMGLSALGTPAVNGTTISAPDIYIYEYGAFGGMRTGRTNRSIRPGERGNCHRSISFTINPTRPDLGSNPGNFLRYDTVTVP